MAQLKMLSSAVNRSKAVDGLMLMDAMHKALGAVQGGREGHMDYESARKELIRRATDV